MSDQTEKIRSYWDQQATELGEDLHATTPDAILRNMEIRAISDRLTEDGLLVDIGCGNGYSTLQFALGRKGETVGIDYSEEMIKAARSALQKSQDPATTLIRFEVGDVLSLPFATGEVHTATSDRCLINLTSVEDQKEAISEIHRVLRPGGLYLMCECTQQGLSSLNRLRGCVSLPEINTRWHNLYLDETEILPFCQELFEPEGVDNFSSTYYLASRIFNGKLAEMAGENPRYDHPINEIASRLPAVGDYGPVKLFLLRKR